MNIDNIIRNITDQIKEGQLKLGYIRETVRLYYPEESLMQICEYEGEATGFEDALKQGLKASTKLGPILITNNMGRYEFTIGEEGVEYVHGLDGYDFLKSIIELFAGNHHCSLKEVQEVFAGFGSHFCEKMPEDSDFDYVFSFADEDIDPYYYCIKFEMGHTIYHRFTKWDYESFGG